MVVTFLIGSVTRRDFGLKDYPEHGLTMPKAHCTPAKHADTVVINLS
jgi:hypothetical protein